MRVCHDREGERKWRKACEETTIWSYKARLVLEAVKGEKIMASFRASTVSIPVRSVNGGFIHSHLSARLHRRAASRWFWIAPVPDDDIIWKKTLNLKPCRQIERTLNQYFFCLDNGEGLSFHESERQESRHSPV